MTKKHAPRYFICSLNFKSHNFQTESPFKHAASTYRGSTTLSFLSLLRSLLRQALAQLCMWQLWTGITCRIWSCARSSAPWWQQRPTVHRFCTSHGGCRARAGHVAEAVRVRDAPGPPCVGCGDPSATFCTFLSLLISLNPPNTPPIPTPV